MSPRLGALLATALLATGCGTSASKADNDRLCAALRADLKTAGLATTPTREQARDAALRLDPRVTQVAKPALHEAVVRLHQHLHSLDVAWRRNEPDNVARAAERVRNDARGAARACGLSSDSFLSE